MLGQQVVAGVNQAHLGSRPGPCGGVRVEVQAVCGVFEAVDVKFHLQTAHHAPAAFRQLRQGLLQLATGVKRHRRAVLKDGLALHPAGFLGPGQHFEAALEIVLNRHQQQVAGELKTRQFIGNARFKDFERCAVGGVFEHQGTHHAHAAAQGFDSRRGGECFAAQHAVGVAPGKAHQL